MATHRRRVTLKDVAREANVPFTTASFVLNESGSVSKDVSDRVRKVVKKLGYQPNQSAQAMRTGKTNTIGLILPGLSNPFFSELAASIEKAARHSGYSVFLVNSDGTTELEQESMGRLVQRGVDGVLWFPATQENAIKDYANDVPVVVMDRALDSYNRVIPDHWRGGQLQAEHLLDHGHKRFGFVTGPLSVDNMRNRRDGAVNAIEDKGEIVWQVENSFLRTLTPDVVKHLKHNNVDAIVAGNDMMAIAIMQELTELGIRVPQDVSIVGFDDIPWCTAVTPPLTTIRMPLKKIGEEAMELLLALIQNPESRKRQIVMDVDLIPRKSVADCQ